MVQTLHPDGSIEDQVLEGILVQYPGDYRLILPFTRDFQITWGRSFSMRGTRISAYLFKPLQKMRDSFGFRSEIAVFISDYKTLQPRVVGAIGDILKDGIIAPRVDPTTFFLISADENATRWLEDYFLDHPQAVTGLGIPYNDLDMRGVETLRIYNLLTGHYYSRDLFDYRLPINEDINFYGRPILINELKDRIRKSENFGLYGLRKSGKTSSLYKVMRDVSDTGSAYVFYYDCKSPEVRGLGWDGLLVQMARDLLRQAGELQSDNENDHASARFRHAVHRAGRKKKLCIIFDEIEYISPLARLDVHWRNDFIPFWQTLWSVQSSYRRISFGMCGVNPAISEMDSIDGVQNPVFGIVQPRYVQGLKAEDCRRMVKNIGDRMGLTFTDPALDLIYAQYGGHPMLTRLACSQLHNDAYDAEINRPILIDKTYIENRLSALDSYVEPHCKHALSEIERFYPEEYDMLTLLAAGHDVDFYELARDELMVAHIKNYGIVAARPGSRAKFLIPAMKQHLVRGAERAAKPKAESEGDVGSEWLQRRLKDIAREFDRLQQIASSDEWPWKDRNVRFDKLSAIEPVNSRASLTSALTVLNSVLIEPIDKIHGKSYFFAAMHTRFPQLAPALARIRVYRNWVCHDELNQIVKARFENFISDDFGSPLFERVKGWESDMFAVTVNELYYCLIMEIDRYT